MNQTITFFVILTMSILTISCKDNDKNKTNYIDESISKIEVLDFHSTHRCMTCKAIEANTKYTLNTFFTEELKQDKISLRIINVDEKANKEIAEKFQASGTSLMLNVIKKGKETQINLTDFAFMNGNDKERFSKELKTRIEKELKAL